MLRKVSECFEMYTVRTSRCWYQVDIYASFEKTTEIYIIKGMFRETCNIWQKITWSAFVTYWIIFVFYIAIALILYVLHVECHSFVIRHGSFDNRRFCLSTSMFSCWVKFIYDKFDCKWNCNGLNNMPHSSSFMFYFVWIDFSSIPECAASLTLCACLW